MIYIKELHGGEAICLNFDLDADHPFSIILSWEHLVELVDALAAFRERRFPGQREIHQAEHDPELQETLRLMYANQEAADAD